MANPHETTSPPADRSGADVAAMTERIRESSLAVSALLSEIRKVIVGQSVLVERLVIGLLADGHVLLEGVPGLAKTLAVRTLSRGLHASFSRIQFTPDLLPADLVGTLVFNPKTQEFVTRRGPVFAHILLADEINRAPAKVQSALLEAMQERQVTIGDTTHPLPDPFLVLATQNPIEQEGTYPLPEAQVDRFLMKLRIGYPTKADERQILERMGSVGDAEATASVRPVLSPEQIRDLRALVRKLYADERIKGYLVELVAATREPEDTEKIIPEEKTHFWDDAKRVLSRDRNFNWFLSVRILSQFATMGFSFYIVYALREFNMTPVIAGYLTATLTISQTIANIGMGWLGDKVGHRVMLILGAVSAVLSAFLAWNATSILWFYPIFILTGMTNVSLWTISMTMTVDFGGESERPIYIGLAQTLTAPATIIA
ncbi:MFS transporter, partial [Acidobacteria bacterium ACD]|nr:MFS transporter [Acidobacteria bacterium ACD]